MISNVNQSSYLQANEIKKNSAIHKADSTQNIENSKIEDIKKSIEDGTYQIIPTNILAKVFTESELGL